MRNIYFNEIDLSKTFLFITTLMFWQPYLRTNYYLPSLTMLLFYARGKLLNNSTQEAAMLCLRDWNPNTRELIETP